MELIDTHAHLDNSRFNKEREKIIRGMKEDNLKYIVNIGANLESSRMSVELAGKHDCIFAVVGVHPHDADTVNKSVLDKLRKHTNNNNVVAVGETGLDFHYDNSPRDIQEFIFRAHLRLAKNTGLPVVIHSREAWDRTQKVLIEEEVNKIGGIIHCFNGGLEKAKFAVENDLMLGIGGLITFGIAELESAVEYTSMEKIVLETDSPYITPEPKRGKKNRPKNVYYVAKKIAELKGLSVEEVAEITTQNACRVFDI